MASNKTYKYNNDDIMALPPIIKRPSISGPLDVSSVIPNNLSEEYLNSEGEGLGKYGGSYNGQILSIIDEESGVATPKVISDGAYVDLITSDNLFETLDESLRGQSTKLSFMLTSLAMHDFGKPLNDRNNSLPSFLFFCAANEIPYYFHQGVLMIEAEEGGSLNQKPMDYGEGRDTLTLLNEGSFHVNYNIIIDGGVYNYYHKIRIPQEYVITEYFKKNLNEKINVDILETSIIKLH